jgi:hypothetical protein
MVAIKRWEKAALLLLLLAELWIFSGSFDKFYNLDSLFYQIHVPRSWQQLTACFMSPDAGRQYRPATLAFMAAVTPFLGVNPRPYHWIPLVFHLLNTLLLYQLARRLFSGSLGILFATAFWGLHSVVAWITYDATCISDFLLAFLALGSMILAIDGVRMRSTFRLTGSLICFLAALLTKEAALTLPLGLLICLTLADRQNSDEPGAGRIAPSIIKSIPWTALFLAVAVLHASLLLHWFRQGLLYTQGAGAAYDIGARGNLVGKTSYLYWALNLPDALALPNAARNHMLALGSMLLLLLILASAFIRPAVRSSPVVWGSLTWFVGMNVPALLLSSRTAKWYLYVPLLGLALCLGFLVESIRPRFAGWKEQVASLMILIAAIAPVLLSSRLQARSYLVSSDAAYQSGILQSAIEDFQRLHPILPANITLFMLPDFDPGVAAVLSASLIDKGQLYELFYPGTRVQTLFAHKGDQLPADYRSRADVRIVQHLDGRFYDVTDYFRETGRMTLFVLPTIERKPPPLLKKNPVGGRLLYTQYVEVALADEGGKLPQDYFTRSDLWILQYLEGHFCDVTDYYKGRRRGPARRILSSLEQVQSRVDRREYYPDYSRFATPTGTPVFFPTTEKEILTQIGGSEAVIPLGIIPPGAQLRFDISWMYDHGDGGWAELRMRAGENETVLLRRYMRPNPPGKGLTWEAVSLELKAFQGQIGELILRCYNNPGANTVADWLNWRDLAIETPHDLNAAPTP